MMSSSMPQPQGQSATHDEVWEATVGLKERFRGRSLPHAQIERVKDWTLQYKVVCKGSANPHKKFFWTAPTGEVLESSGELRKWFVRHPRGVAPPSPAGPANRATFAHNTIGTRKRSFAEVGAAAAAPPNAAPAAAAPPNAAPAAAAPPNAAPAAAAPTSAAPAAAAPTSAAPAAAAPTSAAPAALAKKASFVGTKGGVGKSTSCKQISAAVAAHRPTKQTVVVDLDPQCHQAFRVAGTGFYPHTERGGAPKGPGAGGLYEMFDFATRMRPGQEAELGRRLAQALRPTQQPNLWVLFASNTQVKEMEVKVQANPYGAQVAWARINELLDARFDFVFFDTPGTQTSNLLPLALSTCTLAVLVAEPHSEYTNVEMLTTADKCRQVKAVHNRALEVALVLNKVDGRTSAATAADMSRELAGRAAAALGGEVHELGALRLSTTALKKTEADAPLALMRSLPPGGDAVLPEILAIGATLLRRLGA